MTGLMFGMEVEVAQGSSDLAQTLYNNGLSAMDHLHSYHCHCAACDANPDRQWSWACQEDSTVDGEFISKPLTWGSDEADTAILSFSEAALEARARTGGRNDCPTGNHVHVSRAPFRETPGSYKRLARLFSRYQDHLCRVAAGKNDFVRGYNYGWEERTRESVLTADDRNDFRDEVHIGSYLTTKLQTIEFRLWNSTVVEWRLRLHAGLSVAMAQAALDGVEVSAKSRATFAQVVGPYMTPDVLAFYVRQVRYAERNGVL